MLFSRLTGLALLMAASFAIVAADVAEARIGGGRSFGSRGTRTYNAPPATNTAPSAAPVERSMTQKNPSATAQNTGPATTGVAQPSRFGGMRGLLMGGLFAAALGGIFGFGALASALGFLLQFALIAGVIYLAVSFFRSRNQPGFARASAGGAAGQPKPDIFSRRAAGATAGGTAPTSALKIGQADLDSFERLLGEIQTAYGREDTEELGARSTSEMLSYFLQELSDLQKQGVRNEISNVKLLQGDLAEAWRENGSDYATVALRYALTDVVLDRATGRVVSGDASNPTEATELWTFRRDDSARAAGWQLAAIQQTASASA